jgi:phosphoribosylformylglycinamidine (FGAM) synthase-like enzyme
MDSGTLQVILGGVTFLVGVAGAVKAGARLTRSDMAETVQIQHTLWEETRQSLEDCRADLARARDS